MAEVPLYQLFFVQYVYMNILSVHSPAQMSLHLSGNTEVWSMDISEFLSFLYLAEVENHLLLLDRIIADYTDMIRKFFQTFYNVLIPF